MLHMQAWWLAVLIGCSNQGTVSGLQKDIDGDGIPADQDCDDANGTVYAGAPELCDGIDNNCNDETDEGVSVATWLDDDGDGFGSGESQQSCGVPTGRVENNHDCDDSKGSIHPNADEVCDGIDNDCDNDIDLDPIVGGETYYMDLDNDGFGDPSASIFACELPLHASNDSTDCDDSNSDRFPGNEELCDGIDNNCNDAIDDNATDVSEWWFDADNDSFGAGLSQWSCEAPSNGWILGNGDCDDSIRNVFPGAPELCDQTDNDCNNVIDDNPIDPLSWYTDLDSDGYGSDLAGLSCSPLPNSSANDDDCNDTQASIHPGAVEICLTGDQMNYEMVDQDCDGISDANEPDCPILHCGELGSDEVWTDVREHLVTCNTYTSSDAMLTIEDGSQVYFHSNGSLTAGDVYDNSPGHLEVAGDVSGVFFDSWSNVPFEGIGIAPQSTGDIRGLTLSNAKLGMAVIGGQLAMEHSTLQNLHSTDQSVQILQSQVSLKHVTIENGQGDGILANGSTLDLSDIVVRNHQKIGLRCISGLCLAPDTFENNILTSNREPAVFDGTYDLDRLGTSSSFSGNQSDILRLTGPHIVVHPHLWLAQDVPYGIDGPLTIDVAGALTLAADVEIHLLGAQSNFTVLGTLKHLGPVQWSLDTSSVWQVGNPTLALWNIQGSEAQVFIDKSTFDRLLISIVQSDNHDFDRITVKRGGLQATDSQFGLSNSQISNSPGNGLFINNSKAEVLKTTISKTADFAIVGKGAGELLLDNSTISDINGVGIHLSKQFSKFTMNSSTVEKTQLEPIRLETPRLMGSSLIGNNWIDVGQHYIQVNGNELSENIVVLNPGIPWKTDSGLIVSNNQFLSVQGATWMFSNSALQISNGNVDIQNSFLTSFSGSPGGWGGIEFYSGGLNISNSVLANGGSGNQSSNLFLGTPAQLSNVTIQNSSGWGVTCGGSCYFYQGSWFGVNFYGNAWGDYY